MDNRTLLATLNLSQQAWGRLCGVNERTARNWFVAGVSTSYLVNLLLRYFSAHATVFADFREFAGNKRTSGEP